MLTDDGYADIEDIGQGDYVLAENPEAGEQEYKEVARTFTRETDTIVHVHVGDEEIETTEEHPFYVEETGWVAAGDLKVGDVIRTSEGESISISKVETELDTNNIPNMTKQDIIDSIPDDWNYTEHNGFVHIRDADGNIRIRIDPPDEITNYPHVHTYDSDGNLLNSAGNIVDRKSLDGHIPYKDN